MIAGWLPDPIATPNPEVRANSVRSLQAAIMNRSPMRLREPDAQTHTTLTLGS
jgi:hypothetical protein